MSSKDGEESKRRDILNAVGASSAIAMFSHLSIGSATGTKSAKEINQQSPQGPAFEASLNPIATSETNAFLILSLSPTEYYQEYANVSPITFETEAAIKEVFPLQRRSSIQRTIRYMEFAVDAGGPFTKVPIDSFYWSMKDILKRMDERRRESGKSFRVSVAPEPDALVKFLIWITGDSDPVEGTRAFYSVRDVHGATRQIREIMPLNGQAPSEDSPDSDGNQSSESLTVVNGLEKGATVSVDQETWNGEAANIIDQNPDSQWQVAGTPDTISVTFRLPRPARVIGDYIRIGTGGNRDITRYELHSRQSSSDSWSQGVVVEQSVTNDRTPDAEHEFDSPVMGRQFRLVITDHRPPALCNGSCDVPLREYHLLGRYQN